MNKSHPPSQFKPQMAYLAKEIPEGKDWLHEIKLDGYRIISILKTQKDKNKRKQRSLKLLTRNNLEWQSKLPELTQELLTFPAPDTILDGEIVVLDKKGISRFQLLQNALKGNTPLILFFIFDMPYYAGFNLSNASLIERKNMLRKAFRSWPNSKHPHIFLTNYILGQGKKVFKEALKHSLEGIISKNISSHYIQKRDRSWQKSKCGAGQEFIICGFTEPKGQRHYFGSLLLGVYNSKKELTYCGNVGTGFSLKTLKELFQLFKKYIQKNSPFIHQKPPIKAFKNTSVTWLKPKLICQIKFLEWTQEKLLRQPSFLGLRMDKKAHQIKKEVISKQNNSTPPSFQQKRESRKKQKDIIETHTLSGIKLTHPNRIFEPTQNITKLQVAKYYDFISEKMLPHLRNRPVSIFRSPGDAKKNAFFQKHHTKAFPKSVLKIKLKPHTTDNEHSEYLMVNNKAGLISLVQFDVLEFHPWGSQKKSLEKPDRIIFDLDPGKNVSWKQVIHAALYIREELKALGLKSFVKLSGGKGLHLVIPIKPQFQYPEVKKFTHLFATKIVNYHPNLFTSSPGESKRIGKIFIDYLRNVRGATSVAPYSTRSRPGAPVSMPLTWEQLKRTKSSNQYTLPKAMLYLKRQKGDPWEGFFQCKQSLSKKMFKM